MEKNDLLKFCKYYKGESANPYDGKNQNAMMFWNYEKAWCEINAKSLTNEESESSQTILHFLAAYSNAGLSSFRIEDDTPISLKALLYNRFDHWFQGTANDFKGWYVRRYLNE